MEIAELGGAHLLNKYGGLYPLLSQVYPSHDWNRKTTISISKSQKFLFETIEKIFPGFEIFGDYPFPGLRN
jgi:hypothetical protein